MKKKVTPRALTTTMYGKSLRDSVGQHTSLHQRVVLLLPPSIHGELFVHSPWCPQLHLRLYDHEPRKYAQACRRGRQHHDEPDVELNLGPVMEAPSLAAYSNLLHFGCGVILVRQKVFRFASLEWKRKCHWQTVWKLREKSRGRDAIYVCNDQNAPVPDSPSVSASSARRCAKALRLHCNLKVGKWRFQNWNQVQLCRARILEWCSGALQGNRSIRISI